jgi:hypothetical protein
MFPDDDVTRFFAWWEATGGGNVSLRCAVEQAWIASARRERMACVAICQEAAARYPTDVFPEHGKSLDCKSAKMARLTAANIEREIMDRGPSIAKKSVEQAQ